MTQHRIQWTAKNKPKDIKHTTWFNSERHMDRVANSILDSGGYINKTESRTSQ